MKKLFVLCSTALLFSCGQGNNKPAPPKDTAGVNMKPAQSENKSITLLDDYQKFISALDTTDAGTATLAANKYRELFASKDTVLNDKAYVIFDRYYNKLMFGLNDFVFHDPKNSDALTGVNIDDEKTYPASLRDLCVKLRDNGFRFIEVEGSPQIAQHRLFVTKMFYPSLSVTMRQYLDEVNKENEEGFEDDGGLIISVVQLADRTIWWEQFAAAHPGFIMSNEVAFQKQIYFTYLVRGMDNSPILDYETKTIDKSYKEAYEHLIAKYPGAETTKLIKPYYDALLAKNNAEASRILESFKTQKLTSW